MTSSFPTEGRWEDGKHHYHLLGSPDSVPVVETSLDVQLFLCPRGGLNLLRSREGAGKMEGEMVGRGRWEERGANSTASLL